MLCCTYAMATLVNFKLHMGWWKRQSGHMSKTQKVEATDHKLCELEQTHYPCAHILWHPLRERITLRLSLACSFHQQSLHWWSHGSQARWFRSFQNLTAEDISDMAEGLTMNTVNKNITFDFIHNMQLIGLIFVYDSARCFITGD